jgi:hypothetical protein
VPRASKVKNASATKGLLQHTDAVSHVVFCRRDQNGINMHKIYATV